MMPALIDPNSPLSKSDFAKKLQDPMAKMTGPTSAVSIILASILNAKPMPEYVTLELLTGNWAIFVETANKYNKPGEFTAFISYEWKSIPSDEIGFHGSHGAIDDRPQKRLHPGMSSSGTFIRLRFFGSWDFDSKLADDKDFVKKACAGGVPMGSDLPPMSDKAKAPTFVVWAQKDPESGVSPPFFFRRMCPTSEIQVIRGCQGRMAATRPIANQWNNAFNIDT